LSHLFFEKYVTDWWLPSILENIGVAFNISALLVALWQGICISSAKMVLKGVERMFVSYFSLLQIGKHNMPLEDQFRWPVHLCRSAATETLRCTC